MGLPNRGECPEFRWRASRSVHTDSPVSPGVSTQDEQQTVERVAVVETTITSTADPAGRVEGSGRGDESKGQVDYWPVNSGSVPSKNAAYPRS